MTCIESKSQTLHNQWWQAVKTVSGGLAIATVLHWTVAEVRYIPSGSMTPTLQVGDRVLVEKLSYYLHSPQRGDIIVFQSPPALQKRNVGDDMIKRVVGVPGDIVAVRQGHVYVNNHVLPEPYVQVPAEYHYGSVTIPQNQYFVLGDNRNHSYDSHLWGFVPQENILGRAVLRLAPSNRMGTLR